MTRRVLVTGGCGFVGRYVADALATAGHEVRIADRRAPGDASGPFEQVHGDLGDPDVAARAVEGVDAVCHQAAMVGLGVDFRDAPSYAHHNVVATAALLAALHDVGFAGRIVLASSMVVYGEGAYRCDRHGAVRPAVRRPADLRTGRFEPPCPSCGRPLEPVAIDETAPTAPRNVYAATKLAQEHLCAAYSREHAGCSATALRYHNVYGPGLPRDTPYAGVASIFLSAIGRGEAPRVFEDGGQRRDFVHVRDVARANVLALASDPPYDGPLNVASGSPRTVLDLAEALTTAAGAAHLRPVVTGEWRAGDVRHVVATPARASDAIGFRAEVPFAHGVRELASDCHHLPRAG